MVNIKITNLNVKYPPNKNPIIAIDDLSVDFKGGKVNVILGPSGCGKTTLLKAIAGTLPVDGGHIYFDDTDINYLSIKDRNVALVNQNIAIYPHLNVFNNIAYPLTSTHADIDEIKRRVYEVADLMQISHLLMRKPKQISIGQAQRVAIAKAVVKKPLVYLLDEPFSNLDVQLTADLIYELKKIFMKTDATVLFVTHSAKEAFALGDYIYVMDNGKLVDQGNANEIINSKVEITQKLIKDE